MTVPSPRYESHFGVYALIRNPADGRVLLIRKTLGCYTGLYDLPGGTMEPHELLEETLHREVFEETDCRIVSSRQLGAFSVLYPKGDGVFLRHLAAIYEATVTGNPRETSDGSDDSGGCVWVLPEDLSEENAAPLVLRALLEI